MLHFTLKENERGRPKMDPKREWGFKNADQR